MLLKKKRRLINNERMKRSGKKISEPAFKPLRRNGGAALLVAPQRAHQRRRRAAPVQAPVLVETVVLGGDQRVHHRRGNLAERHPGAVHPAVLGQQLAVRRHQLRRLLRLGLADIADARRERNQHQHILQQHQPGRHQRPEQAVQRQQLLGPLQHTRPHQPQRGPARAQESRKRNGDWGQKWLKRLMDKR